MEALEKWEGTAQKGHFPQWAVYVCILPLNPPPLFSLQMDATNSVVFNFCIRYFGKVTNVLNIATNAYNWHYSVSRRGTLP